MAAPVRESAARTTFSTSVTSMTVTMPSGVASGDRLVAKVHVRNAGTWTPPSGWTERDSQVGGGSVGELTVFEKISDGSEGADETWTAGTASTAEWEVARYSGAHASSAIEIAKTSGDVSTADSPNLAPSWGSEDTMFESMAGHSAATDVAWSAGPSGYSNFLCQGVNAGGASVSLANSNKAVTASSENPGAFTVSGSNRWWAAMTIAIRPAAGAGFMPRPNPYPKQAVNRASTY